jgi:hypothetical protein
MPTLPYLTDTSTQLTGTYTASTAALDNFTTSNYVIGTSNTLQTKINTKQDTLTAATNILGVGSAITALDYTKITLNKPTDFQANWNTTVINKPTNFQADWTSTIINKPTNFQADWTSTIINKPTNFQADWNSTVINKPTNFQSDYNTTVINKPTYVSPLSSNAATNQISVNLSSYSTTGTDANYLLKTGGTMTGTLNGTTINATTALQEAGTNLTSKYLQLSGGTLTGTLNGTTINATTALQEAGTNLTSKYLQLAGGSMTANANITLSGTGTFTGIHSGNGAALTNLPLSAYSTTGNDTNYLLKTGGTLTGTLNGTTINATTALQEAGTNLTSKYLQLSGGTLTGNLSGTTINTSGNVGIGVSPSARLHIYEATGTVATPNLGSIIIDHDNNGGASSITFRSKFNRGSDYGYIQYQDDATINGGGESAKLIIGTQNDGDDDILLLPSGNVGINTATVPSAYKLYVNGATYFNGASIVIGTLTATTFSGSGASLTNLPLSAYSTTGNDANYLLKTGGAMTGQITGVTTLNGTTGIFSTVSTTNNGNANTPQLGNFGGTGDRLILYGGTASVYPYSLGINSFVMWYSVPATASHIFYVGGSPITTISSTGLSTTGLINASTNLQEGGTNLSSKYLQLAGGTMTGTLTGTTINATTALQEAGTALTSKYLKLDGTNTMTGNLTTGIVLAIGAGATASKLHLTDIANAGWKLETGNYNLNFTNDYPTTGTFTSKMTLTYTGNVGIGITNPFAPLTLGTPAILNSDGYLVIAKNNGGNRNFRLGFDTNFNFCIGDFGNTVNANSWQSTYFNINYSSGNVGIGAINQSYKLYVSGTTYFNGNSVINGTTTMNNDLTLNGANLIINKSNTTCILSSTNEGDTTTLFLGTPFQNTGAYKAAIIAQGISSWSRSYLHFCLNNVADNTRGTQNAGTNNIRFTIKPDGNFNFYPDPFYINNTNGANLTMNLNLAVNTTATPATSTFLSCTAADGWNSINTITTISCGSRAYSGYYNESRMILDGSMGTNSGRGTRGSYIYWQSIDNAGNWMTNAELYTTTSPVLSCTFNVNGSVKSYGSTLTSSSNIKEKVRDIYDPLDLINKFEGKHYHNKLTGQKDFGLIAEDIEQICPCLTSRYDDTGVEIGVKYMNLTAVLIEGIKELNKNNKELKDEINRIKEIITIN